MALGMSRFLTDVLALVHDVSNRARIVAAGNTVALLVVDLMYGAIRECCELQYIHRVLSRSLRHRRTVRTAELG
jgi:hypothetical protein